MSEDDAGRPVDEAVDAALTYLAYRPRSTREVERRLKRRGFDDPTIAATIERLEDLGLVDDPAFVEVYVRDRIARRPMGVHRMAQELYRKGIPRERAEPIIEQVFGREGVSERVLAERAAEKRVRALRRGDYEPEEQREKLRSHLIRRGFDFDVVRDVVERFSTP